MRALSVFGVVTFEVVVVGGRGAGAELPPPPPHADRMKAVIRDRTKNPVIRRIFIIPS
jgi:hypothetical protein